MIHQPEHKEYEPLFVTSASSSKECGTSDEIPIPIWRVSPAIALLLGRYREFRLISCVGVTPSCRAYVKAMLLQDFSSISQDAGRDNNVVVFSNMQIASDTHEEPFYWLYSELSFGCCSRWLEAMLFLSSTIIYEYNCQETDLAVLQKIAQNRTRINSTLPHVLVFHQSSQNITQFQQQLLTIFPKVNCLSLPTQIDLSHAGPETMQGILENRTVILKGSEKFKVEGVKINSELFVHFLKTQQQIDCEENSLAQKWEISYSYLREQIFSQCLMQYKQKMKEVYQGRKAIALQLLARTHQNYIDQSWSKISEKLYVSQQIYVELTNILEKEYQRIVQESKQLNFKNSKQYIMKQFSSIENRVRGKLIKSGEALKQDMLIFCQFIRKKSQFQYSQELYNFFYEFIVMKAIDCYKQIEDQEKQLMRSTMKQLTQKLEQQEIENKQFKKIIMKKQSQLFRQTQTLQSKIASLEAKEQMLMQTIEKYKNDVFIVEGNLKKMWEEKEKHLEDVVSKTKNSYELLLVQVEQKRKKNILLLSQIEKEKLLHEQTKQNYEILIDKQKTRQQNLECQLELMTRKSMQDVESMERSSLREIEQSQIKKKQNEKQIKKLSKKLDQFNQRYDILDNQYKKDKYEYGLRISDLQTTVKEQQLNLRLLQQQNLENQSKIIRYNILEEEVCKLQKMRDEDMNIRKEGEKNNALMRQEIDFLSETIENGKKQTMFIQEENKQLKVKIDELNLQLERIHYRKTEKFTQTEKNHEKQQLQQALQIINKLEQKYNKLKVEAYRNKIKS